MAPVVVEYATAPDPLVVVEEPPVVVVE